MDKSKRHKNILDILKRRKIISVQELLTLTYSSKSTLRRDLIALEKQNRLIREYGHVKLIESKNIEYSYNARMQEHQWEKRKIAAIAMQLIDSNMTLFLDSSSTLYELTSLLNTKRNLTVVTNGIFNAEQLDQFKNVHTFLAGGRLYPGTGSVLGEYATSYLNHFKVDLTILSCSALDAHGVYMSSSKQASLKRKMMQIAKKTLLLCDSSKFEHTNYFKLSDLAAIDTIITDKAPSIALRDALITADTTLLF
ncbi:DeoR/GlpR family DNA-binding transcription regulator [Agrilactobacillus composti]|uniref:DeoR/GlpR family DNA-binding transcription regulator n=1 Tax=Agrilactobacillus composti TaxID=398555 RepID=UPI00138ECD2F|nr:DeoR/GlpR family DNA-binding transcription regulator [Agrilactobacillus composti]